MTAPTRRRVLLPAGPRLEARLAAQRRERRRVRLRRASWAALALVPVCLLAWLLLSSPLLAVHRVEVTGTSRVTPQAVLAAAGVPVGTPLARVDVSAVGHRVQGLPDVARVRVVRAWPGTLRLQVRERTPVGQARGGAGWVLVDAGGTAFGSSAAPVPGLPEVQAPDAAGSRSAATVLAELPAPLRDQVATAQVAPAPAGGPATVALVLADGRQVVWGSPGGAADAARKAAVVAALLPRPGRTIDVSSPTLAVVSTGAPAP